jgi:hypothetical protein
MKSFTKRQGQVLIVLVTSLFLAGGAGTASKAGWIAMGITVDTLDKRVEKAVFDPERRDRIMELTKKWREKADAFFKAHAGRKKELLDLIVRHDSNPDEFRKLAARFEEELRTIDRVVLDTRSALRDCMSRSEWEAVFGEE